MCCTGKCPYENWMGDCTIKCGQPFPKDAGCADEMLLLDDPEYIAWLDHMASVRLGDLLDEEEGGNA